MPEPTTLPLGVNVLGCRLLVEIPAELSADHEHYLETIHAILKDALGKVIPVPTAQKKKSACVGCKGCSCQGGAQ